MQLRSLANETVECIIFAVLGFTYLLSFFTLMSGIFGKQH